MKFKYVGPNAKDADGKDMPVNAYGGNKLMNGDVVELNDWMSSKAEKNPNYARYNPPGPKPKKQSEVTE